MFLTYVKEVNLKWHVDGDYGGVKAAWRIRTVAVKSEEHLKAASLDFGWTLIGHRKAKERHAIRC